MASCTLNGEPGNILSCRTDWQSALDEAIRDPAELCRQLDLDPALGVEAATGQWPLSVPRPYLSRIRRGDPADPLLLQVLPQAAELATMLGYSADPLDEAHARCGPGLLRKYQGRILMVTTGACAVHCRFCFRRHFPFDRGSAAASGDGETLPSASSRYNGGAFKQGGYLGEDTQADNLDSVLRTIAADRSIHEIILSGGDPLMLSDRELAGLAERLAEIPHLRRLRIHSRMPVVVPRRVTDELIGSIRSTRLSTIMVVHVNHPAEIDEEVAQAFSFDVEIAGGLYQGPEGLMVQPSQAVRVEQVGLFEIGDGLGYVLPIGVLGEDGPDHNLEWRISGPPVLRAEMLQENIIECLELFANS